MEKPRRLLFSVTAKDLDIQTFCTGGNGGQHRNAKQNGVRLIHRASGARAEHRDGRDQGKNRREAFLKLLETPEWKAWSKMEVSRRLGLITAAENAVEEAMAAPNLRIEVKGDDGTWHEIE
jgi:protein subunit release factor A